jgi:FHA domain-containing protein
MLILRVVAQFGQPLAAPLEGRFERGGGTIGRSPDCTMVLPDPGKHISRQQARVDWVDGAFLLTCLGSASSLIVNGAELATGQSVRLQPGDTLLIAQYEVAVDVAAAPSPPAPAGGPRPAAAPPGGATAAMILDDFDPFAPFDEEASKAPAQGAQALGLQPFDAAPAPSAAAPGRGAARGGAVDDPLAALGGAQGAVMDSSRRDGESIDALFGLSPTASDPLGLGSPLSAPPSQPNTASSVDPLASLSTERRSPEAPQTLPDRGHEMSGTFRLPEAIPQTSFGLEDLAPAAPASAPLVPPVAAPVAPARAPAPTPALAPGSAPGSAPAQAREQASPFLSWQTPDAPPAAPAVPPPAPPTLEPRLAEPIPATSRLAPEEVQSIVERVADEHRADFEPPPRTRTTDLLDSLNRSQVEAIRSEFARPGGAGGEPAGAGEAAGAEQGFELLKALLLGLGLSELPAAPGTSRQAPPALTPELMKRIGELLRIATQGTIDLLQARATVKREMKAEVTMIVSSGNNPLKFSPDALSAIQHLLAPHAVRGFMPPVPAMRDAYDDLLAHQVAFIAGMRAAMEGLIARFDPQQLEARLTRRSMLDSMLPMARRARLWELFNELFADISREAEDDFETLFGREFVRAYEAQIDQLTEGRR